METYVKNQLIKIYFVKMFKFAKKKFDELSIDDDLKYLVKNSKYKLINQLAIFTTGFFMAWCLANFTSPEFYGLYLFVNSVLSFFSFLSFVGISQSLLQSVASGYDNFLISSIKKTFKYSLVGTFAIMTYLIFFSFFSYFNYVIFVSLTFSALIFPILNAFTNYQYFLDGKGEFRKGLIFQSINLAVQNVLILILVFITQNLILYFILVSIITLFNNILFTKNCLKIIENKNFNPILDKEALSYGLFLTKYGFITIISLNISNLIIGSIYGVKELAFYVISTGLSVNLTKLIKPSLSVLMTKYSKKGSKISKRFLFYLILGSIFLFILVNIFLPIYLDLFFPIYKNSISFGIAYSFILLIYPLIVVLGYYFSAKIEKNVLRMSRTIPDILVILLIYPFLLWLGIYGLILIEFLKNFFRLIVYFFCRKKIEFE